MGGIFERSKLLLTIRQPQKDVYKFLTLTIKPQARAKITNECREKDNDAPTTEALRELLKECQRKKRKLPASETTLAEILASLECPK